MAGEERRQETRHRIIKERITAEEMTVQMAGEERRQEILKYIEESEKPVSGQKLAEIFHVSRQVIVQDIALLRAGDREILSTNRGYVYKDEKKAVRIFRVFHSDEQIEEELNIIVDWGGRAADVFVEHEVYGELRAALNISSRMQVRKFLEEIRSGKSRPLTSLTSGYHCHTVYADSEEILDRIQDSLKKAGILSV